ncbi:D-glycero-beta-D-manno-heptose 1,7-bisphosphate 7-phosphatase [Pseudomonas sp. NPDC007930]|uniref:D-glycero-beta-D-manno-heptose 1,7-bisphosphate 7-phosphatase n=1 Tax=Pseudomonas sp. NPDC007930 TaxID=3364417 RepID=UPI0036F04758
MKLLILDRDGVINHDSDAYIKALEEWLPIEGSVRAIADLSKAGWVVAVATNQSGIARGYYSLGTLEAMHRRLRELVAAEGGEVGMITYCPHGPDAGCECRKPLPGMLRAIAEHYGVGLEGVWFVGDSASDLQAARACGAQPVLVKTGKGEKTASQGIGSDTLVFDDLAAVARALVNT